MDRRSLDIIEYDFVSSVALLEGMGRRGTRREVVPDASMFLVCSIMSQVS